MNRGNVQGTMDQVYRGVDRNARCTCGHPAVDHLVRILKKGRITTCREGLCPCRMFSEQREAEP